MDKAESKKTEKVGPKKSKIEHNNTKPGLCRKGGSWTVGKDGKLEKPVAKTNKTKPITNEDGGK